MMYMDDNVERCPGCSTVLSEPYIKCAECVTPVLHMCLHCFSRGLQTGPHKNYHQYYVVKDDFELFGDGWTAGEETKLLNGISNYGIGNWAEVAQHLQTKSKQQCQLHYEKWYINNPTHSLPAFPDPNIDYGTPPVVFRVSEDPPRPPDDSPLHMEMSGYIAARGDFSYEYDNFAELDIKDMDFDTVRSEEDEVDKELKLAVLDVYLNRLRERHRRKKIVRDYGLINLKKLTVCQRPYERAFGGKFETLKTLCRLLPPFEYEKYIESLLYQHELRSDIKTLQEYREQGITSLTSGRVHDKLKANRDDNKTKRNLLSDIFNHIKDEAACQQWLQRQAVLETISKGIPVPLPPNAPRRSAPPLDIASLPGYDKLSERERELCSTVRLVPLAYQEFRDLLVSESNKHGYLRLAQARNMIKIDVNKTRKIYDFMVSEGLVRKEPT